MGKKVVIVEPYLGGSHAYWAKSLQQYSRFEISIVGLKARFWKWRMQGGAISLAEKVNALPYTPDLFIATDMLHVALFKSLLKPSFAHIPILLYFHENQISYPLSINDTDKTARRDNHYAFINYTAALVADAIAFNSVYHYNSFFQALSDTLQKYPDEVNKEHPKMLQSKSSVLAAGINIPPEFEDIPLPKSTKTTQNAPLFMWNHRWEYDKNPEVFFQTLFSLKEKGIAFRLAVCGERNEKHQPPIFAIARKKLAEHIIHWGFLENENAYFELLKSADILLVTAQQDFFGISVVEAMYFDCIPLLPKRLAYCEHIPESYQPNLMYENDDEILPLLSQIFSNIDVYKKMPIRSWVEKYLWRNLVATYDCQIAALMNKKK
ncbi:MAG: DUF3524 domain-containing protein [Chitinophagales bacterium]|nr:DUF3524 domain-containing protein [Bacteroidota bacterium]MCB9044490.1 DUF3524 domain-containing protein [Chitinophagales bacterium]